MNDKADTGLSAAEIRDLADIAGTMVPASTELGMPGADDPAILADIVKSLGRDLARVREAVRAIGALADGALGAMHQDKREALINDCFANGGAAAAALGRVVLGAYYRDDRVLLALGMEARAPFPKGYALEQGDWSLLDAVRNRPPLWRDDRAVPGGER
ncbi:MAG: hypothetical protein NTV97_26885 [Alphaproteobacteria bacterium]|nr:hypothetical protein [Alphaproteobacteria bacterium]